MAKKRAGPAVEPRGPFSLPAFRRALLTWFDRARRDLPWRHSRDPYRIWVSEVMLQQTTVAAVVPYFQRFVAAFPTVQALADASETDVLRHWEGLGYYRRARHLHASAKLLAARGEPLPDDAEFWRALPGVGRYILGAVLSQAFERRLPVVEANTLRVLARLFGYADDPRTGAGQAWLWATAARLLPRARVGDFNQAMMELGALVCSPKSPACGTCPVAKYCAARADGSQGRIPRPKLAKPTVDVRDVALVVRDGGRVLLGRRPATAARWANLWEFPHAELRPGETLDDAAMRLAATIGIAVRLGAEVLTVRHGVTRFAIAMTAFAAARLAGDAGGDFYAEWQWLLPAELPAYPVSSPQRKLAEALRQPGLFDC